MNDENTRLFDDEDQDEDLILASDAPADEEPDIVVAKKGGFSREFFEEIADKWQVPLLLLFTVFILSLLWVVLGTGSKNVIGVDLKNNKSKKKYESEEFQYFNQARRDAAQTQLRLDKLADPMSLRGTLTISQYINKYDQGALGSDHRFPVSRMGDQYAQTVVTRLGRDSEEVSTGEILNSLRWLETNLETGDSLRGKQDLLADTTGLYEEYGDRSQDTEQYQNALFYLEAWNEGDPGTPRYHYKARLHFKAGAEENMRASREFVDASLRSLHPQEVANRFEVKTLYGKILAHEGQIREAEKVFANLIDSAINSTIKADTSYRLGEMRQVLGKQFWQDGKDPLPWFDKAEKAFVLALDLYEEQEDPPDDIIKKQEMSRFHIGSIWMFEGLLNGREQDKLVESRDMFNRLRRRNSLDLPFIHAINVRRAQVGVSLDRGSEAEEIVEEIMERHEDRYWDRTKLVNPSEVVTLIQDLAELHEKGERYRNQVKVLSHLTNFLQEDDKDGRMRNAIAISRAWVMDAEKNPGQSARDSHRQAAETYLSLLAEPRLRFQKEERFGLLWSAYQQFNECFDRDNLQLWETVLARKDKEKAMDVLDHIIDVGVSPRTNRLLNQAYYLKGLLQEELLLTPEAIRTHELNIGTQHSGGDNIYIYLSYLQRARARASLGSLDNLAQAIKDCEALFEREQVSPDAVPWQEARFLHGKLNFHLASRAPENSDAQLGYLKNAVRSLNEAIDRYPDSPQILEAHVSSGLAKMKLSKLDSIHATDYIEVAIANFATAEKIANTQVLDEKGYNLKKKAMMNLGLAQLELEGDRLQEAANTFDRLSRAFRRDRVEPWALVQRHRAFRRLAQITQNTARQSSDPSLEKKINDYLTESERAREKAIGSWEQLLKLANQPLAKDFPLDFWQETDSWFWGLEESIDDMKRSAKES